MVAWTLANWLRIQKLHFVLSIVQLCSMIYLNTWSNKVYLSFFTILHSRSNSFLFHFIIDSVIIKYGGILFNGLLLLFLDLQEEKFKNKLSPYKTTIEEWHSLRNILLLGAFTHILKGLVLASLPRNISLHIIIVVIVKAEGRWAGRLWRLLLLLLCWEPQIQSIP